MKTKTESKTKTKAPKQARAKAAIVVAYRAEETDLAATIQSALESAGEKDVTVFAVEDKTKAGPGQTRHRGIEAAAGCDVVVIIDAHMRFQGFVLRDMIRKVRKEGGLLTPFCHHNEACDLTSASFYAGARILYRVKDAQGQKSLDAKWASGSEAGPVDCVMGACYVFRRDWYYAVGQPLAILPGWGGDEQVLSIAAWLSGKGPEVFPGHVAHLYRQRPPWAVTREEVDAANASRAAVLRAFVPSVNEVNELEAWAGTINTPAETWEKINKFRAVMLKQPRSWQQWKDQVCEAGEIDGQPISWPNAPAKSQSSRRPQAENKAVHMAGVTCPHCHASHDPIGLKVINTYPFSRRFRCPDCGLPFIAMKPKTGNS